MSWKAMTKEHLETSIVVNPEKDGGIDGERRRPQDKAELNE